ncbi:hypothetical protein GCM10022240_16830 [Microbacterium kribbense]|uniref:DUF2207 domain-containing protein n=1 Tax=Microbacterium kribbense TaxID=433645 RepID=A0ABP7GGK3_9MICO
MLKTLRALTLLIAVAAASILPVLGAGPAAAAVSVPAVAAPVAPAAPGVPAAAAPTAGPVAGDVNDFTFQSMHADYTIGRADDGTSTLRVVETFVALFPNSDQNHGMRRVVPDSYNGQPLQLKLVSVTDGDGRVRPAEVEHEDDAFTITSRADGFVHGAQTYVFTYTLRHVTWTFADTDADEFYWDVNGNDWSQPFGAVSATLHVPADLAGALTGRRSCMFGAYGDTTRCDITAQTAADGSTTITAGAAQLPPRATVTIAVGFTTGTFTPFDSSYLATPWGWLQGVAGLGALGVLVAGIGYRRRKLADAAGRPTIIAEYTPPPQIDALQSAVLLGQKSKAIPAEVLEQAVVGSIRILEGGRKLFGGYRLQAQLVDRSRADGDGRMLLNGLFSGDAHPGATFEFGRTDRRFSAAAVKTLAWADKNLVAIGLRRRPAGRGRGLLVLLAGAFMVAAVGFGVAALAADTGGGLAILVLFGSGAAFVVTAMLTVRKPLTSAGAEARDHLRGLREFIEWAEADRIRMLQSPGGAERVRIDATDPRQVLKLYEKLLPYAVVFGQEKRWADQLAVLYSAGYGTAATPYWYAGTHGFDASSFAAGIGSLSTAASSSSTTSGGSGGGGSAGGGGGGGGGGGV